MRVTAMYYARNGYNREFFAFVVVCKHKSYAFIHPLVKLYATFKIM